MKYAIDLYHGNPAAFWFLIGFFVGVITISVADDRSFDRLIREETDGGL